VITPARQSPRSAGRHRIGPRPAGRIEALVGGLQGAEYARQSRPIAAARGGTATLVNGRHHFDIVAPLADPASAMTKAIAATIHAAGADRTGGNP
jgi:hypothetical protein